MTVAKSKEYSTIEELQKECSISNAVFAGVKAGNNWKSGKQVTREEFENAWEAFLNAPADGRKVEAKG